MIKVRGSVTLGAKPMTTGTVSFISDQGKSGMGAINSSGKYDMWVLPGTYKVGIAATEGSSSMDAQGKPVAAKSLVPEKYTTPQTSGLTATVSKENPNADFKLEP